LNYTFEEYSLYTEVFINGIDFTLIVELYVVSPEANLIIQTGLTIRTPKHSLLPLVVLVPYNTPLCCP
jgi:hypothetical protein